MVRIILKSLILSIIFIFISFKAPVFANSGVAIDKNGTVYYAQDNIRALWAVKRDEKNRWGWKKLWEFVRPEEAGGKLEIAPVLAKDGTVYITVALNDSERSLIFYAISPKGKLKWKRKDVVGPPLLGVDGTVYGWIDGYLSALTPEGKVKWKFTSFQGGNIVIGKSGNIYFYSMTSKEKVSYKNPEYHKFFCAVTPKGKLIYKSELPFKQGECLSGYFCPAVASDGTIYIATQYYLYALSPSCQVKWKVQIGQSWPDNVDLTNSPYQHVEPSNYSPVVDKNGIIYYKVVERVVKGTKGEIQEYLTAISPDGKILWKARIEKGIYDEGSPLINQDGDIIVMDWDCNYYRFSSQGKILKQQTIKKNAFGFALTFPVDIEGNIIYFFGSLNSFKLSKDAPWPKYRCNARNTCNVNDR